MVTIESLTKIGMYSWLLKYSSDFENPMFYIYMDGRLITETPQTQYNIALRMDESSVIEVLDDASAQPMQIFPGKLRLGWFFVEGTNYYRIDEYIDSIWTERYRMPENNGYLSWQSRFLEDGQTHIFRVVPVGTNGNEGTARQFAVLMCRRPDVPQVEYNYNEGAGSIIISDPDSPPNDLINHCIFYLNCNDNLPNTIVTDSMKNSDGTSVRNTEDMHTEGKINGALGLNGINDLILVEDKDAFSPVGKPFSISCWVWMPPSPIIDGEAYIISKDESAENCEWYLIIGEWRIFWEFWEVGLPANIIKAISEEMQSTLQEKWTHIVATYDGGNSPLGLKIYVNKQEVNYYVRDMEGTFTEITNTDIPVAIGAAPYTEIAGEWKCDELRIFDKELSQAEIDWLNNDGNGRKDW